MTDDLVKQSIAELQDIVRCRCKPAFKDRGMHDPDCECDSADAVQVVADRIEELEAKLDLSEGALDIASRSWGECQPIIKELEAKLAKAVRFLNGLDRHGVYTTDELEDLLAELKGQDDE